MAIRKQDALEKLLEDDVEELCVRNCAVLNKEDKKSFVWKTQNYKTIDEVNVISNSKYISFVQWHTSSQENC